MTNYKITLRKKYDSAQASFVVTRFMPTRVEAKAQAFAEELLKEADGKNYTLELVSIERRDK